LVNATAVEPRLTGVVDRLQWLIVAASGYQAAA
jgi:hypothetical protein